MKRQKIIAELAAIAGKSEEQLLLEALNQTESVKDAARALGVEYRTLWGYMVQHNIRKVTRFEKESA